MEKRYRNKIIIIIIIIEKDEAEHKEHEFFLNFW